MKRGVCLLFFLLAGCAHYSPQPLVSDSAILSQPLAAVIEAKANTISRPWLKPVTIDLSAPLTLDAIAVLAVVNNPDLKAQRARAGVSDAQIFAAGLLPDPSVSIGASRVLSGPDTLLDLANALALDINALRTRGVTRAQAAQQAKQVRLDLAWAEWQTAGQARLQAVRIRSLEQIVALATESRDSANGLLEQVRTAAARGDVAGDRLQSARIAALDAADRLNTARQDLATARGELLKLIGFPPNATLQLAPSGLPDPPPSADALFTVAKESRADLQALQAGYAAQEAAVHKAVLDQFPTLNLTINANRDSAGNLLAGPAVDFSLPLWNRNRGGIAIERATRDALRAEYDARLFQTRADIAAAEAGLALAYRQRRDALLGLAGLEVFAASSRRAAKRGDVSDETALAAEQALRDRRTQIAQAEQAISEQSVALELLVGAPREAWNQ